MKLLAYLKIAVKGIIKEFPTFILSYGIYPLVLALLMGFVQKDMFTPVIEEPIFSIVIADEDKTVESQNLIGFLSSEEISQLLTIKDESQEFDYTLRIPKGYENSLYGKEDALIKVEAEEKASSSKGNILVTIIDKYNQEISQGLIIEENMKNIPSQDRETLVVEISHILNNVYSKDSIKSNIHSVRKSLNSYEYYSISFLNFFFIMFLMAIVVSDDMERENGLYSRIMSTSMTKIQNANYGIASNLLTVIIGNIIYVAFYRISGLSFQGSIISLLMIILIQSLMITTLGTLLSTLLTKKYGMPFIQLFLMIQMLLGGTVGPLDKWSKYPIFKIYAKYNPAKVVIDSYRNYLIYNDLSHIYQHLFIMIIISLVFYILNALAIQRKWGVKR